MKKFSLCLVMLLVLSVNLIADDGHINTGGKSCPPNQTCLVSHDQPEPDKNDADFISIFKSFADFILRLM